ncbi:hypothetical protein FACUT_10594 [Fusarium acutatum]|uniref:Apple domain-containing protein n=1 Tax=Fusarium acutatum TaxID=78861 RepID=A0A8H4JHV0_9HYPO|nr:hypothetical protein FACUT_10594 [Fusarium acutatum]
MSHYHLVFYLACLAYLSVLVIAQCNVTGTYDSCCKGPSSTDNKVVTFQGKEFRVHCSKVAIANATFERNPADCAKTCSSQANCVNAFWRPPIPPSQWGRCDSHLIENEAQSVSFVWIDSAECRNNLETCQNALRNCKPGDPNCPGNLKTCQDALQKCKPGDPNCPGNLKTCQDALQKCKPGDPNCPGNLKTCQDALRKCKPGDPNCPGNLKTCQDALKKCDRKCPGKLKNCQDGKKKCENALKKCKNPRTAPFSCKEGKVEKIGGTNYRHHCSQVQVRPRSHQPMVSAADPRECAKQCTQRRCAFIMFVNTNACYLHDFAYSGATKSAPSGYTVLERV